MPKEGRLFLDTTASLAASRRPLAGRHERDVLREPFDPPRAASEGL